MSIITLNEAIPDELSVSPMIQTDVWINGLKKKCTQNLYLSSLNLLFFNAPLSMGT